MTAKLTLVEELERRRREAAQRSVRFPVDMARRIERLASDFELTFTEVVVTLVQVGLDEEDAAQGVTK